MANHHFSTSSSVYSPVESEYRFHVAAANPPILEEAGEEDDQFDAASDVSAASTSGRSQRSHKGMLTEYSAQTFNTFVTANGSAPSFTSINNSLLRTDSAAPPDPGYDNDETPRLDSTHAYDNDAIDKTPLIGAWPDLNAHLDDVAAEPVAYALKAQTMVPTGYREDAEEELLALLHRMSVASNGLRLPQEPSNPDLGNKFERLSVTLLQNGLKMSQESYQFQLEFSLNVQRANSTNRPPMASRTSTYYKRINARAKDDEPNPADPHNDSAPGSSGSGATPQALHPSDKIPETPIELDKSAGFSGSKPELNGGLNISFNGSADVDDSNTTGPTADFSQMSGADTTFDNSRYSVASSAELDTADMSVLFIRALHSFDATESQLESDSSVCLSFQKGDIAFVHTIDDSGWGEVTLLETLDRGWIPMNFFSMAVNSSATVADDESAKALQYSRYMSLLLDACGKFILNPLSHTTRNGKRTFSIRVINAVRDGVRLLLQETDCLSRSNELVSKKPVVRKARKTLLSDWYNLMLKANKYKGTSNYEKIEILNLLVFQVIRRATVFFEIWARESSEIIRRETEVKLQNDMINYPLLASPPSAKQRVTEINGILFSYLALIIGRLDLIEHNPAACDMLETVTHHVILLLRELLFISKTGSDFSLEKPADLDGSLDALLSLVNELVTGVKSLVIKTVNETDRHRSIVTTPQEDNAGYVYTDEGKHLIQVASKMIRAIGVTISSIRKLFDSIGDYKLSSERSYPDYAKMRVDAEVFIKKCSAGMAQTHSLNNKDLRTMKQNNTKSSNRYSMFRSGRAGDLGITPNGVNTLHRVMLVDNDDSIPFSSSIQEFKPYMSSGEEKVDNETYTIKDELLIDANGNLLGASFKGLVYTLTNESSPPEYFFVSTFFICFRSFASSLDLTELLFSRFDTCGKLIDETPKADALLEVKLKSRRRLICKMFQIWLESYWVHELDSPMLTTLINFFNEGVFHSLPIEAMKLIEVASRLLDNNQKASSGQLIARNITLAKINRKNSFLHDKGSEVSLSSRYSMVDGYELSRINTNSSVASSLKSMTLPLPLGVSGQTSSASSLLTKGQLSTIEVVVLTYRAILGENWCLPAYIDTKSFIPLKISSLLPNWYTLCDQNWVLSNYRPNLLDFNGLELAKQLTLIESEIFCAIKPDELLNENFTAKKAHLSLAKNVRQSLLFTNCLSGYVLESVLQPKINHKLRVNIVKTWLKVAISCLYLRNFNSLAAIITSLQSHLITRLTKIWENLSEKYTELYEYLSSIVHPEKNYSVYRAKLKSFLLSNNYNIPVVPYFSLFLQDLTFVTDGNPNYRKANTFLNQKLINIDKYLKITRVIADIESLQIPFTKDTSSKPTKSPSIFSLTLAKNTFGTIEEYTINAVPALQELVLLELWKISQLNKKEEDRAWKLSCMIQPRDTPQVNKYHDEEYL